VVSIDALYVNSKHYVYDYLERKVLSVSVTEFAKKLQEYGAGEIFINSVDRDGIRCGYDLQLINDVCASVTIPIICCGGAGKPQHLIDVLKSTSVNAVAAGNFFHFSEHSVTTTKAIISKSGIPVRHETHALYNENRFASDGRLLKKEESELEELLYHRITKEVI
jgi:cyclase